MDFISVNDAAKELGKSAIWVRKLIHDGRLPAQAFDRFYLVRRRDLDKVRDLKRGRPKGKDGKHETNRKRATG